MSDVWRSAAATESFRAFLDPGNPTGLRSTLHHVLGCEVDVEDLGRDWVPERQWLHLVRISLPTSGATTPEAVLPVPALVDDEARRRAPFGGLGNHGGTFLGRPHQPTSPMAVAPGARIVVQYWKGALRCELELVPGLGRARRVGVRASPRGPRLVLRGDGPDELLSLDGGLEALHSRLSTGPGRHLCDPAVVTRDLAAGFGHVRDDPEAPTWQVADLQVMVGVLLERHAALAATAEQGEVPDLPPGCVTLLDPGRWTPLPYGDLLGRASHQAALAAVGRPSADRRRADRLLAQVVAQVGRELDRVGRGRGRYANAVSSEEPTNAVGRLETARQTTFIGPWGLADFRLRMDVRVLPEGWDGTLCPVQTPESTRVGLDRYAAWGTDAPDGAEDWAGLSVCASLVPYVNHDDPTRTAIGAKMQQQALLLESPTPARVTTPTERSVAEAVAAARAPARGVVSEIRTDAVVVRPRVGEPVTVPFGHPPGVRQPAGWRVLAEVGQSVRAGDLLALGPEAVVDADGEVRLALGRDALTAFLPWHGWNFEDGVVVSASFAERMASRHLVTTRRTLPPADGEPAIVDERLSDEDLQDDQPAGTVVAVAVTEDDVMELRLDEAGRVVRGPAADGHRYVALEDDGVAVTVEVRRPLEVGDKVTTRHGGKGVVGLVVPDDEMPRMPDGRPLEVLLNPLGVLRRLNIGTVMEINAGLLAEREGDRRVVAPRALGAAGRRELAERLAASGAPGGRVALTAADGSPVGPPEGVLAGPLHVLKLHHLARAKLTVRRDGGAAATSYQPVRSRAGGPTGGRAQRMGEMEVWGLLALGMREVVSDLVARRGTGDHALRGRAGDRLPPATRALAANLAVAGIQVEGRAADGDWHDIAAAGVRPDDLDRLRMQYVGDLVDRPALRDLLALEPLAHERLGRRGAPDAVAAELLRLARAEPGADPATTAWEAGSTRWFVPLPEPVWHPWRIGPSGRRRGLPQLRTLALPPDRLLGADPLDAVRRDHPLALTHRLLSRVLHLRHGGARASATAVQDAVDDLLGRLDGTPARGSVARRLQGKGGLMTRHLLGTAAYRSGRGVLTGDPTLDPEEIALPVTVLEGLGIDPLTARGVATDDEDNVVLLNRQPTLQPQGLVALKARVTAHHAVVVHPHVLAAIAGDFDGDTAAVHRPGTVAARREIWQSCRPAAAVRSDAHGGLVAKLDLDVALGALLLGTPPGLDADVEARLADVGAPHRGREVLDILHAQMAASFAAVPTWGFSIADLPDRPAGADEPDADVAALLDDALAVDHPAVARIREAFHSGSGGKPADVAQLLVRRGAGTVPDEFLRSPDVPDRFVDGLATDDYFAAAQVSVGLLAAKKLVTPLAGALTRRLVTSAYDVVARAGDCGAPPTAAGARSPLTCAGADPCHACYGDLRRTGRPPMPGARIGILAGMVVGESSTQLAMKSIHQRGRSTGLAGTVARLEHLLVGDPLADVPGLDGLAGTALDDAVRALGGPGVILAPALAEVADLLPAVDPVHVAVLLRSSLAASCAARAARAAVAEARAEARAEVQAPERQDAEAEEPGEDVDARWWAGQRFGLEEAALTGDLAPVVRDVRRRRETDLSSSLLALILGRAGAHGPTEESS